jgi:hypothetical protein
MGRLVSGVYKTARPMLGFIRWREKYKSGSALTQELVDEYLASANWWEFSHPAYHINMDR